MRASWCLTLFALFSTCALAQAPVAPLVKEGKTGKLTEHVFAIPDELVPMVPNVGIVVGKRSRLVRAARGSPRRGRQAFRRARK